MNRKIGTWTLAAALALTTGALAQGQGTAEQDYREGAVDKRSTSDRAETGRAGGHNDTRSITDEYRANNPAYTTDRDRMAPARPYASPYATTRQVEQGTDWTWLWLVLPLAALGGYFLYRGSREDESDRPYGRV